MGVASKRQTVSRLKNCGLSERKALKVAELHASTLRHVPRGKDDTELRQRLRQLAGQHRRHGYRMLHNRLRGEGLVTNVKRTYRIYREEGLMVRRRTKRKLPGQERQPLIRPLLPGESWSMDRSGPANLNSAISDDLVQN